MEEPEVQRVLNLVQKAVELNTTTPDGRSYTGITQYMVKSSEDAIKVFSEGRFDVTADLDFWYKSEYKKVPNKYIQVPSPVPDTDIGFTIVESNVIDAGLALEYIVQQYLGKKQYIYFAIVIPGLKGNYGVEWGIEIYYINKFGREEA